MTTLQWYTEFWSWWRKVKCQWKNIIDYDRKKEEDSSEMRKKWEEENWWREMKLTDLYVEESRRPEIVWEWRDYAEEVYSGEGGNVKRMEEMRSELRLES